MYLPTETENNSELTNISKTLTTNFTLSLVHQKKMLHEIIVMNSLYQKLSNTFGFVMIIMIIILISQIVDVATKISMLIL